MGRSPCWEKDGLKKRQWTPEEDQKLLAYIEQHGHGCWHSLPAKAGLQRCRKSCRLRWTNYLRPDINRGKFSLQEEQTIIRLHALLGNRWSAIAAHLPKRTDNEIKNYWNTHLKKRLANMGIDPVTHKPRSDALGTGGGGPGRGAAGAQHAAAHLNHTAQWESARLEAEACALAASASASASVSAPPQMPGPAAAHRLDSLTSMSLSFSESAAQASVMEEFHASVATARAAMPQPMQAHEEARKDHLQQQQWGDRFVDVDVADADIAAAHRLDSPTSMLSYSESATHASVLEELVAAAAAARAAYAMPQPMQAHEEARKDHLQQQQWGDHVVDVADADIAAVAFAGMLLDGSLIQQQTEEEKKYWVSIMNLVNSSSAPLQTSVAMPAALEASSSSASLQTSVVMPAPEAYSRRRPRSRRQSTLPD